MVWYGMVWYGMVWYGMVWYGMVCMYVYIYIYIVKGIAVGASVTYGSNSALALCYIWLKGRVSATRDRVAPSYRKSVCCKPRVEDFNIVKTTDLIEYK